MTDRDSGQEQRPPARDVSDQASARSSRGMPSLRGTGSLRGGLGRNTAGGAAPSNASMVPSRSSYATASGSPAATVPASGVRMQFRPVIPQRRKPSESPAPQIDAAQVSTSVSVPTSAGSPRGSGSGRGRGGARPPRQSAQMTASGPFALGPSSRPSASKGRFTPLGPGGSTRTPAAGAESGGDASTSKTDPDRATYRNPDKLKDTEEYSDPEDAEIAIIDMDQVYCLDDLAPIALPRVAEKTSKKDRIKAASARQKKMATRVKHESTGAENIQVKSEADVPGEAMDETEDDNKKRATTVSSGSSTPQPQVRSEEAKVNATDALDLSESEGDELMDDLVDDFVFNHEDMHRVPPENRLYLFQFPQLFPKFEASSTLPSKSAHTETSTSATGSVTSTRRTVSFAEGTTGGAGSTTSIEVKDESADEDNDLDAEEASSIKHQDGHKANVKRGSHRIEGQIGKLDVYRDGRVFFRFGELVMEVTGGSQSTFLQQVMLLNQNGGTATALGELHRKFIVTPELDCMLNDISVHDEEQRVLDQKIKRETEEKELAERRSKFGGIPGAAGNTN